jgi:hypothetical protein
LRYEYQSCAGPIIDHLDISIALLELVIKELLEGQVVEQAAMLVIKRFKPVVA